MLHLVEKQVIVESLLGISFQVEHVKTWTGQLFIRKHFLLQENEEVYTSLIRSYQTATTYVFSCAHFGLMHTETWFKPPKK